MRIIPVYKPASEYKISYNITVKDKSQMIYHNGRYYDAESRKEYLLYFVPQMEDSIGQTLTINGVYRNYSGHLYFTVKENGYNYSPSMLKNFNDSDPDMFYDEHKLDK